MSERLKNALAIPSILLAICFVVVAGIGFAGYLCVACVKVAKL